LEYEDCSVTQILKQRIGERVGALKISWRKASIDAGLGVGFIQDIITGRAQDPSEQAIASLAAVLKCSPAYLMGQSDEAPQVLPQTIRDAAERPDAVMTLKIVDELLTNGHVDAAHFAVKRALKEIRAE
jgi:hypothetical protein